MGVISEMLVKLGVDASSVPGDMKGAKKAVLAGGAVIGAAAVASAKKLYDIGSVFDGVEDTIRVGTGATGKHLEGLVKSADRVGRSIPAKFEDIGTTVSDLNRRLNLTGPVLEKVTKQFLEAGRMTDDPLNVQTFTGAFNAFDVKGKQIPKVLDDIFQISQSTGVGMNDLAASVGKNAPLLKQFGFGITDSAALLGTLDKAGLNGNKTVASLSKAMVVFAKDGKKPRAALEDTISQIEGFTKKGQDAKAINLAASIFGTKGASQFVAAVKSGKVNLDDLMGGAGATGDTILKASKDTADFSEKWEVFKNRVMLKLKPLALEVFNAVGDGMDRLAKSDALPRLTSGLQTTGRVLKSVFGFIVDNKEAVGTFAGVILTVAAAVKTWSIVQAILNTVLFASPVGLIVLAIAALAAGLVYAYKKSDTFRAVVDKMGHALAWLGGKILDLVGFVRKHWLLVGTLLLGPIFYVAVQIVKHWDKIYGAVSGGISKVIGFVKSNWKAILATLIAGPFGLAVALVVKHWDRITGAVHSGVGRAVGFVKSLPGRILGAIGDMGSLLLDAGRDLISGLLMGIREKSGEIASTIKSYITDKIPGPVRSLLPGMGRVMLRPGQALVAGLINGIASGEAGLDKQLGRVTDRIASNLARRLKVIDRKIAKKSISKAVGKHLEKEAKAQAKSMTKVVDNAGRALAKIAKQYEKTQAGIKKLKDDRKSMAESISSSISGELDLGSLITTTEPNAYGFGGGTSSVTFKSISAAVSGLAAKAKKFAGKLKALLKAGIPRGLVQEVAGLGTDQGIAVADALLSGTSAQIADLSSDYADVSKYANNIGDVIAGAFYDNRIKAQESLLAGLLEKKAIRKAAKALAEALTDELIAALSVHTPKSGKHGKGGKGGAGHRFDIDAAGRVVPVPRITPSQTTGSSKAAEPIDYDRLVEALAAQPHRIVLQTGKRQIATWYVEGKRAAEDHK